MARVPTDQIKEAITHDYWFVRQYAALHFAEAYSADPGVLPKVLEAIESFGWGEAFALASPFTRLAHSADTITWCLNKLDGFDGPPEYLRWLCDLVASANVSLLAPRRDRLSELLPEPFCSKASERLALSEQSTGELWRQLEAFCDEQHQLDYVDRMDLPRGYRLVEALARDHACADAVLDRIAIDSEDSREALMEGLCVRLAGELCLEAAIPHLERKLHIDTDWLREQAVEALARINTDAVVDTIADGFITSPWHYRLYASAALETQRGDTAVEQCLDLARRERHGDIKSGLFRGALINFASEAVGPAAESIDPHSRDQLHPLLAASVLTEVDFPNRDVLVEHECLPLHERSGSVMPDSLSQRQKSDARGASKIVAERAKPATASPSRKDRPGRNDPCHCGSGKKYKRCCLPGER